MTDKELKAKILAKIEMLKKRLIAFHRRDDNIDLSLNDYDKMRAYNEIETFINSLPEEDVSSVWHKPTEIPKEGCAIVAVTDTCEFLQDDAFFLDKYIPNWEGFVKEYNITQWAYKCDLIDKKEEPVSEKKCMFTKDIYTDEDRKVLCEDCEEKCEYSKKEEPVGEDLEEAAKKYAKENYPDEPSSGQFGTGDYEPFVDMSCERERAKEDFIAGAQWEEDKTISKAVEWLHRNVDSSMWLMNFKKSMEE